MKVASGRRWLIALILVLGLVAVGAVAAGIYWYGAGRKASTGATPSAPGASGGAVAAASAKGSKPGNGSAGGGAGTNKEKPATPVSVAAVTFGQVSSYIISTANLVAENDVKVLAEAEGRVAEVLVEEGNRVARGQVLAQLVRDDAEIALKKSQVKATNAQMNYDRAAQMVAESLMSREEFDRIAMENGIAQQEEAEARWRLEKTTIRAPFNGRVTERKVRPGQNLRLGEELFSVANFDPIIARIYLPERDVLGMKAGRSVRIILKANEATRFSGRVRQISPVVDPGTGTVKITIEAVAPPPEVRPGAFVNIEIVRETHPRTLLVPREAVIRELQAAYVFVARGEKAERRSVSLGLEEGGHVEALSGLSVGEKVIVAGQGSLKDGARIKILPSSEASDLGGREGRPRRG